MPIERALAQIWTHLRSAACPLQIETARHTSVINVRVETRASHLLALLVPLFKERNGSDLAEALQIPLELPEPTAATPTGDEAGGAAAGAAAAATPDTADARAHARTVGACAHVCRTISRKHAFASSPRKKNSV